MICWSKKPPFGSTPGWVYFPPMTGRKNRGKTGAKASKEVKVDKSTSTLPLAFDWRPLTSSCSFFYCQWWIESDQVGYMATPTRTANVGQLYHTIYLYLSIYIYNVHDIIIYIYFHSTLSVTVLQSPACIMGHKSSWWATHVSCSKLTEAVRFIPFRRLLSSLWSSQKCNPVTNGKHNY